MQTVVPNDDSTKQGRQAIIANLGLAAVDWQDVFALTQRCVDEIARVLGAEYVAYMELDGDFVVARALHGWDRQSIGKPVELDKCGQLQHALATRHPVLISDFEQETRFRAHGIVEELQLRSGATAIAFDNEEAIGIVALHARQVNRFDADDLLFLQAVTNTMAAAVGRARVLKDLAEREERFRTLCQTVPVIVWSSDPSGQMDFSNQHWDKYCSVGFDELIPRYREFLHPEDAEHVETIWGTGLLSGEPFSVEFRWRRDTQSPYVWMRCAAVPLRNADQQVVRWIGTSTDVDAEKRAKEILEAKVQLRTAELKQAFDALEKETQQRRQAVAELQQLAYVVSHELQEPLRIISSQLGLLSVRYKDKLGLDADEFIGASTAASRTVGRMVDDLWTYARIEKIAGERSTQVDTQSVVERVLADLQPQIVAAEAQVDCHDLPLVVANEKQLEYVFKQLIDNAVRFRCPDLAPRISIRAKHTDEEWLFSVSDNGIGFDMMDSGQIFQMFKRLEPRAAEGTGMGLAICRRILECQGGRIWASSEQDKGSVFFFTVPHSP